jgi:hypothetical protein
MPTRAIIIHPDDDVAVVVQDTPAGETVDAESSGDVRHVVANQDIPAAHKIALRDIPMGEPIRKYGEKIGHAIADIRAGDHVHLHNLASDRVKLDGTSPPGPLSTRVERGS